MPTPTIQKESRPGAAPDVSPATGKAPRCSHAAIWAFDLALKRVVRRPCPICTAEEREQEQQGREPAIVARAS